MKTSSKAAAVANGLPSSTDVSSARENLTADFQSLMSHAEDLLQATTSLSSEGVDLARLKLSESIAQVKGQLGPMRDAAIERSKEAVDSAVEFARERPWQTAAIVVLAALAIGFISNLGRDK